MKKKLKIGFFSDTYAPQVNGVVTSIENFCQELEREGHEVFIFCPKVNKEKSSRKIIRFPSIEFIFQPEYKISLPLTLNLEKKIELAALDIIHVHTPFGLGLLGQYYAHKKNKPLISTYHTLYPEYVKTYFLKGKIITPKIAAKLSAIFSNFCDLNIAPSLKIKKFLLNYGVTKPIEVLPTGIDIKEFQSNIKNDNFGGRYKIKEGDKKLIYVGRLGKEKNVEFLIEVLAILKQQINSVKLLLVGDGPDKKRLEYLAKQLGLENDIIFTGYLSKAEVIKAYRVADVFVFASRTDTQGMVVLEAAASGLPIVAVKDDALKEVLSGGENGFYTERDSKEFAAKINLLLNDKEVYKKMSAASIKKAEGLSIQNQTRKLLDLYYKLL
jgi:1,2-diacylglycerol 3-alpha-glucosyltransferase